MESTNKHLVSYLGYLHLVFSYVKGGRLNVYKRHFIFVSQVSCWLVLLELESHYWLVLLLARVVCPSFMHLAPNLMRSLLAPELKESGNCSVRTTLKDILFLGDLLIYCLLRNAQRVG